MIDLDALNRSGLAMLAEHGAPHIPNLEAYWRDPAPYEAAKVEGQAAINNLFAAHQAKARAEQEARWEKEV